MRTGVPSFSGVYRVTTNFLVFKNNTIHITRWRLVKTKVIILYPQCNYSIYYIVCQDEIENS